MSSDLKLQQQLIDSFDHLRKQIHQTVVGMDDVIDVLFWTILSRGHGLFVGVPGLAKTMLISQVAGLMGLKFNRIQFTPDMMPSDITGSEILEEDKNTGKRFFEFRKGPVFSQLLLADEINRTPPKTQAALLQAMQENKVTYAGKTYDLESPFIVFATQNPIESEGTYPLPEAQLDRFLFSIPVGYPSEVDEIEIVRRTTGDLAVNLDPVISSQQLLNYQSVTRLVAMDDTILKLAVQIVRKTRPDSSMEQELADVIRYGAGPRASQAIVLGAKARALLSGRTMLREEDIVSVAPYVLRHRLVLRRLRDLDSEKIINRLVSASV